MQNTAELKEVLLRDPRTNKVKDGDISVCSNLLAEIRNRAQEIINYNKKAERYMNDITEYLTTLDKRGLECPLSKNADKKQIDQTQKNSGEKK